MMAERMGGEQEPHRRTANTGCSTGHRKVPADRQEVVGHRRETGRQTLDRRLAPEEAAARCQAGDSTVLAGQRHHSRRQRPFQLTRVPEV